jgi:hypothetical protein
MLAQALVDQIQYMEDNHDEEIARQGPATEADPEPAGTKDKETDFSLTASAIMDVNSVFELVDEQTLWNICDIKEGAIIQVYSGNSIVQEQKLPSYFPCAFPCLFPQGYGEHYIVGRRAKIGLQEWAQLMLANSDRSDCSISFSGLYCRHFQSHAGFTFLCFDILH